MVYKFNNDSNGYSGSTTTRSRDFDSKRAAVFRLEVVF